MRLGNLFALLLIAVLAFVAFQMIDVDQVREGRLPNVEVRDGQLPRYGVDVGEVKVGERQESVEVPTVHMEERQVKLPTIEIEKPSEE